MLIKNGADPNLANDKGKSCLDYATENKMDNVTQYLKKSEDKVKENPKLNQNHTEEL